MCRGDRTGAKVAAIDAVAVNRGGTGQKVSRYHFCPSAHRALPPGLPGESEGCRGTDR